VSLVVIQCLLDEFRLDWSDGGLQYKIVSVVVDQIKAIQSFVGIFSICRGEILV
jgi:hypothetical protein